MSEILQSGLHPDADQLSALVERALPAHERERTLAHLAACPACRAVVALSMPSVEEPAKLLPRLVRSRWFSGWNLAWSAALAMTAAILLTIYIVRAATNRNAPSQMASSQPSPRPAAPARPPVPMAATSTNPQPIPARGEIPQDRAVASTLGSTGSAGKPKALEAHILDDRNLIVSTAPSDKESKALRSANLPMYTGKETPERMKAPQSSFGVAGMQAQLEAPSRMNVAPAAPQSDRKSAVSADSVAGAMAAAPAPTASPQPAGAEINSETIAVSAAAPSMNTSLETETSLTLAEESVLQLQQRPAHPLPSRLPIVSMVAHEQLVVAIDAHNTVFLSTNTGKRWKAVRAPWTGRAVKADLVSNETRRGPASFAMQARATGGLLSDGMPFTDGAGGSLTGTVTDATGATIPGATIMVRNATTGVARVVKTDSAGRYVVGGLEPGGYEVRATAPGFQTRQVTGVMVAALGGNVANLSLQVGAATETVTVTTAPADLQADHVYAAKKKSAPAPARSQVPALFEITTDGGEHWTSADGLSWTRK